MNCSAAPAGALGARAPIWLFTVSSLNPSTGKPEHVRQRFVTVRRFTPPVVPLAVTLSKPTARILRPLAYVSSAVLPFATSVSIPPSQ